MENPYPQWADNIWADRLLYFEDYKWVTYAFLNGLKKYYPDLKDNLMKRYIVPDEDNEMDWRDIAYKVSAAISSFFEKYTKYKAAIFATYDASHPTQLAKHRLSDKPAFIFLPDGLRKVPTATDVSTVKPTYHQQSRPDQHKRSNSTTSYSSGVSGHSKGHRPPTESLNKYQPQHQVPIQNNLVANNNNNRPNNINYNNNNYNNNNNNNKNKSFSNSNKKPSQIRKP
jgi:hypothetical protein